MNSDTVHTALKRRNQILGEVKKLETMTCQEGSASGRLKTAMLADLKKDLETAQQDLPQPLPRNTYARKEKEVTKLKQELHDRTAKIQSPAAVKQQLEKDASEIQKRLAEAEMERNHAFNQMSQEKNPEVADQWILDVFTSEAAIKPIVDTWTSEAAHTILGDPMQKQAWFREQLCKHMTNLVHAVTAHRQQNTAAKRVNRWAGLDIDKSVLTEDENMDPNMSNMA